MRIIGWSLIVISTLIFLWILTQFVRSIIWQKRLQNYQTKHGLVVERLSFNHLFKKSYGMVLSSALVVMVLFSGMLSPDVMIDGRKITNAVQVASEAHLKDLISTNQTHVFYRNTWFNSGADASEAAVGATEDKASRDYIKTNVQVGGVDEADIIKTDGYQIYYASRYQNHIRIITIGDAYEIILEDSIDLGDVYIDGIYLTEDYLVVIGYVYESFPKLTTDVEFYHFGFVS